MKSLKLNLLGNISLELPYMYIETELFVYGSKCMIIIRNIYPCLFPATLIFNTFFVEVILI